MNARIEGIKFQIDNRMHRAIIGSFPHIWKKKKKGVPQKVDVHHSSPMRKSVHLPRRASVAEIRRGMDADFGFIFFICVFTKIKHK